MRHTLRSVLTVLLMLGLGACGGDATGEPLLGGDVAGSYDGTAFVALNGFATETSGGTLVILVGTGPIACGSESASAPPTGHNAAIAAPAFTVGTYSNVFVNLYQNVGRFEGTGSSNGTLTITAVTDESIAGEIAYTFTNDDDELYELNGTFEVVLCAF
jgi:hypothetical protein